MATETELEIVRGVLSRVPMYQNNENELAIIAECNAMGAPVNVPNVINAFTRIKASLSLVMNKEDALETVREFLYPILRYRDVDANEKMLLAACAAPVTLESVRDAFFRIKNQLATNGDYHESYQIFFSKHPEYALEANMAVLDDIHHGEEITAQSLEELLENPNVVRQLSLTVEASNQQSEQQEWDAIVVQLIDVKTFIDGNGRRVCYDELGRITAYKDFSERVKTMGLEDLRKIRDDKAEKQRLRAMPRDELRQAVRESAPAWPSRYEPIPPQYVVPGKDIGINWSFQLFKRLPTQEQKRLLRVFGEAQINTACAAQQGRN
jgi:hypothetical protein